MAQQTKELSIRRTGAAAHDHRDATFTVVSLDQIAAPLPPRDPSFWGNFLPPNYVALLGGHGGLGKTKLAIALACHVATGKPFWGIQVRKATVSIFTAEDDGEETMRGIQGACAQWGIDPREVAENLHVLDASRNGAVLFGIGAAYPARVGEVTPSFDLMKAWVTDTGTQLLIVDNASEVFAGNEIDRVQVKQFMRAMKSVVQPTSGSVLLIAHSDKASARGQGGAETYSGSTAWHNSARSRFSLHAAAGNTVKLTHDKANHSAKHPDLQLTYSPSGYLVPVQSPSADEQRRQQDSQLVVLLRLIAKECRDGRNVSTGRTSAHSAGNRFERELASLGCRRKAEINALADEARSRGLLASEPYRMSNRHDGERWAITAAGRDLLGGQ